MSVPDNLSRQISLTTWARGQEALLRGERPALQSRGERKVASYGMGRREGLELILHRQITCADPPPTRAPPARAPSARTPPGAPPPGPPERLSVRRRPHRVRRGCPGSRAGRP